MNETKSPGALEALRAIETDGLEPRVVSETRQRQPVSQAPIYAVLKGDDYCEAEGISARCPAPVLALCRKLVEAGYGPGTPLEAWRGPTLCLRIRTIGQAAKLTVRTAGNGCPIFALEHGGKGARASPARQNAEALVKQGSGAERHSRPRPCAANGALS